MVGIGRVGGNVLYGWALPWIWMQTYGTILGWPICLASCNIAAALVECAYGDWKGRALGALEGVCELPAGQRIVAAAVPSPLAGEG